MKRVLLGMLVPISLFGLFCEDDHVWLAGEALLWRPITIYPYWAIVGATLPLNPVVGNQITVCPSYDWGYRIEVGYRKCSDDLRLSWASLNAGLSHRVQASANENLWLTIGSSSNANFRLGGSARIRQTHHYDRLDGDVGHWICSKCSPFSGRLFAGVRYLRVTRSQLVSYFSTIPGFFDTIFWKSDVQGTGPRFGVAARYDWYWGIQFLGELSGDFLIGSSKGFTRSVQFASFSPTANFHNVRNQATCIVFPGGEVKVGLRLCRSICCLNVSGEVGYQVTCYVNGLQYTDFVDDAADAHNSVISRPFTVDGWCFRLGAQY